MTRSNDATLPIDMNVAAAACSSASRAFVGTRSDAIRPMLSLAPIRAARRARALQLGWVGLVRR